MPDKTKTTTAVVLTIEQHDLVRQVAALRTIRGATSRMSSSDVIREALDAYAPKLRGEIAEQGAPK